MNKNNSSLTISQALKVYNGSSLPSLTLQFSIVMVISYLVTILLFVLLIGAERVFVTNYEEVSLTHMFLAVGGGIATTVFSALTYEKHLPGGKFFRTIKGGFDTYKKTRTALELSTVIGICLYIGTICALNAVIPIMTHGTVTCVSVAIFLLLGTGITNIISMIKNSLARTMINVMIFFAQSFAGVFTAYNGKLGIVHIIAAILAALLIPISHKLMLASYKKNRWDN